MYSRQSVCYCRSRQFSLAAELPEMLTKSVILSFRWQALFQIPKSVTVSKLLKFKPKCNPDRSCLAFSWETSVSSNMYKEKIRRAFGASVLHSGCLVVLHSYTRVMQESDSSFFPVALKTVEVTSAQDKQFYFCHYFLCWGLSCLALNQCMFNCYGHNFKCTVVERFTELISLLSRQHTTMCFPIYSSWIKENIDNNLVKGFNCMWSLSLLCDRLPRNQGWPQGTLGL